MQRLYALIDEKFLDRKYIQQSTYLYYRFCVWLSFLTTACYIYIISNKKKQ